MKRYASSVAVLPALLAVCSAISCTPQGSETLKLSGEGATFPQPLYDRWFQDYGKSHPKVRIDYLASGSGQGVKAVIGNKADFGASDRAITPDEARQVDFGVQSLVMTAGSIVLAYDLDGVDDLRLSREAYAGIFLGKVTHWNDPLVQQANPGTKLPDTKIDVIVRSEASGTSYVFTKHLSAIDDGFAKFPGTNQDPNWPSQFTRAKGSSGVVSAIQGNPGSIGYLEFGYAKSSKIKMARLENKAHKYVEASTSSALAALSTVTLPDDLIAWVPDPSGDDSYPIVTYSWIIACKRNLDPKKAAALKDALTYCLTEGQAQSESLGYLPLPDAVVAKDKLSLENIR